MTFSPHLLSLHLMKIALLHDSFWPEVGGVEQVMRDQANLLRVAGHEVTILCGLGLDPGEGYRVLLMPTLAPDFALKVQVRAVLDRGQADQNFNRYRAALVEALKDVLADIDVTFVHNVFTTHRNLALTRALHDIAHDYRLAAWTHDLAVTNSDYALPNPTQPPWNLMRTAHPDVPYIAVSEKRAAELKAELKPVPDPVVVPNPVDPARLFGFTPEMRESYRSLDLPARDFVFLSPSAATPRKNLDFALEVVKQLCASGRNPLLLITAPPIGDNPGTEKYGEFLRQSLSEEMKSHVVFVSDFFPVQDATLRDLYLLADCLLLPSRQEGFGLPVIEAARFRLPIWCGKIPSAETLTEGSIFTFEAIGQLPEAVAWLEGLPVFRQQRQARRLYDPGVIYRDHYEPLFASWMED
jgi:glycosyltransferase involved in cell wall biosynthesis